ncbi:MAG: hypothetical protein ACXWE1_03145 [Thermoanaerobaculia bacterium]
MKNGAVTECLLVALLASGCASSAWERTEKISSNGVEARLYVPKLWAPLMPGSVYPNKRAPVAAKGRPAVVVVCPAASACPKDRLLGPLAERGIVVLMFEGGLKEPPKEDLLRTRPEAAGAPQGLLLIEPTVDFLRRWMEAGTTPRAVAILQSRALEPSALPSPSSPSEQISRGSPSPFPSSPSKKLLGSTTRRVLLGALNGSEANTSSEGVIEKLYAPDAAGRLPREAYRDAAEWLAGELGAP